MYIYICICLPILVLVLLLFVYAFAFALFIYALMGAVRSFEDDPECLVRQSTASASFSSVMLVCVCICICPCHCISDGALRQLVSVRWRGAQRGHCDTQYLRLSNTNTAKKNETNSRHANAWHMC